MPEKNKNRIVIEVSGGLVTDIYVDSDERLDISLVDWDNIKDLGGNIQQYLPTVGSKYIYRKIQEVEGYIKERDEDLKDA